MNSLTIYYFIGTDKPPTMFSHNKEDAHIFMYHDDAQQVCFLLNQLKEVTDFFSDVGIKKIIDDKMCYYKIVAIIRQKNS